MKYELDCRYDTRKSFYGKAMIQEDHINDNHIYELYSYGTLVACITKNVKTLYTTYEYYGKYSQTTTRHQKEFFRQFGLNDKAIKIIFKNGIYKNYNFMEV